MLKRTIKNILRVIMEVFPIVFYNPSKKTLLSGEKWVFKLYKNYRTLLRLVPKYPLHLYMYFYTKRIVAIENEKNENFDIIKNKMTSIFSRSDDDLKFFITKCFYLFNLIDDETIKMVIDYAKNTNNNYFMYWTTMDVSQFAFLSQKGFYDNYYVDRGEILKKISQLYDYRFDESRNRNKKKLCIVTYCLAPTLFNSMQRVVKMVSDGLSARYEEIDIIVLNSFVPENETKRQISTLFSLERRTKNHKKINSYFKNNVKVKFVKGDTFIEKGNNALKAIDDSLANTIVDISDEYSAISYIYSKYLKTFYIPMRNYASSSSFSYTLGRPWKYKAVNEKFHSIPPEKVIDWCFPEYVPGDSKKMTKEMIGLSESNFVIVTAGKIDKICDNELVDAMISLLRNNAKMIWLLVGGKPSVYMQTKAKELFEKKQIITMDFVQNLSGLYSACDVSLRPNVTGGSGSTAIAAQQKLPIVMTNFVCDPMRWLGYDYSNLKTYIELTKEIIRLYNDKRYYDLQSKRCYDLVCEATNQEQKWLELYEIISGMHKEKKI